jgi:uncharacterized protein YbjT (DUF2867 family)
MPTYAVTGASGHFGRFAVQQLLACGVPPSDDGMRWPESMKRAFGPGSLGA